MTVDGLLLFPGARLGQHAFEPRRHRGGRGAAARHPGRFPVPQGRQEGARSGSGAARLRARRGRGVRGRLGTTTGHLVLGGRSMGGRMCSMVAADGRAGRRARCLISYPLHPPGQPDKLRTAHLPTLTMPCLFVHGTKDPVRLARRAARRTPPSSPGRSPTCGSRAAATTSPRPPALHGLHALHVQCELAACAPRQPA